VVLLPGAGCSISYLEPCARVLAEAGYRAVAVNPRGVGKSTGPLEGRTLHHLAADIAGVLAALADTPVHVLGHAFGNRVARCLAADRPDLVHKVILLAAGGAAESAPASRVPLHHVLHPAMTTAERVAVLAPRWLAPRSDPTLLVSVECSPTLLAAHMATSQAPPLDDWWAGGTAPLLVIQGLADRSAPPSNGHALCAPLGARVQVVDIPQAGHFGLLEPPRAVTDAVLTFLQAQEPGESPGLQWEP
jgi:pimeloyl-ACP methyl ester carboxylesterase